MTDDLDFPHPAASCPPPPAHHVKSDSCMHGWATLDDDEPRWLVCDCEDPANPWPPRSPVDGPRDCLCYLCSMKPRCDRGRDPCEYYDHHCESCHDASRCTKVRCQEERSR